MKKISLYCVVLLACFALLASPYQFSAIRAQNVVADKTPKQAPITTRNGKRELKGEPIKADAKAIVNVSEMARKQAETPMDFTPRLTVPPNQIINEDELQLNDSGRPVDDTPTTSNDKTSSNPDAPTVASPSPSTTFLGHNDVPKVATANIVIPPDTTGAVGLTHVVTFLNNNYVVQNKTTGALISSISIDTFFTGIGATNPFDPRIVYDPYNDRWIVAAVSDSLSANSSILLGVSQTGNPGGAFFLFRVDADSTNTNWADFPTIGFNKNWVSINVNMVPQPGPAIPHKDLVVNYPSLRTGVLGGTTFSGTSFTTAPAITYSSTENTLYQVVHLSSAGAQYSVDTITGTAAAPVYTLGAVKVRTGGGWTQPNAVSSQILPQAAPIAGASSCGATPCKLETQDSAVRSSPVFRNGFIYYAQTIGLPAGTLTRTAVQWTKLTATTGDFAEGGRVDDPTATATNGGKWYAYPSIAVNVNNDVMLGWSQFASNQFPSAGYTYRFHSDAPGLMRDPLIYKAGEDYYNKTFGTGRNRFGDYSVTQVDPSNDKDLWTLQEYSMLRVGVDDGTTGSNSSRWSTWWAKVNFDPTPASVTISGRILAADGRSIARAFVTLTDLDGQSRIALSNPFGYYRFADVQAGTTYILSVNAKGYQFTPQVVNVTQEISNLDFTAQ